MQLLSELFEYIINYINMNYSKKLSILDFFYLGHIASLNKVVTTKLHNKETRNRTVQNMPF